VTEPAPHRVDAADEQRHPPGSEQLWNESYYLDFVSADGQIAGYARIGLYPNLGVTWWTTMIVGRDRAVAASVAYDLPAIAGSELALSAGDTEIRLLPDDPLARMTLKARAPAVLHDEPAAVYRGEPGRPASVELDLVWTTDGVPYHYDLTTRYEIPCLVSGEIAVDAERIAVAGQGQRDHSWGVRDWWQFGWCWTALRLDDGTRVHAADIRIPGHPVFFGYVQRPGGHVDPLTALHVIETAGDEGMPPAARAVLEPGGLDLHIRPLAYGPLLLVAPEGRTSRFPRAVTSVAAADGRRGAGWIEWNQPDPPGAAR
jgi:hypothetical protein